MRSPVPLLLALLLTMASPPARADTPAAVAAGSAAPAMVPDALADPPADTPRMEAYSHGNYALFVGDALWSAGLLALIVFTGLGGRLQARIDRGVRSPNLRVAVYTLSVALLLAAGGFPLSFYASYVREKRYGFSHQGLAAWLGDQGKAFAVALLLEVAFAVGLYVAIRRLGRRWWIAGTIASVLLLVAVVAAAPVLIAPLFNRFEPVRDAALRADIIEMARREGIPADEVYQVDASRRSAHNNAYVAGFLGTERVVLYDTLLERFTPREIKVVMGHEMGHYVLHHVARTIVWAGALIALGLFLADRIARRLLERGRVPGVRTLADPASMPLLLLIGSVLLFAGGPILAAVSRAQEHQADLFALRVTHDPEAAASVFRKFGTLDLGEVHVNPWIEALLFTHPSLGRRIRAAQDDARRHGLAPGPTPAPTPP